jgi:hypothetical protein
MKKWREEHPDDLALGQAHRKAKTKTPLRPDAPESPLPREHRRKKRIRHSSAEDDWLLLEKRRKR